MRSLRHWTFGYIRSRVMLWFYQRRHPDLPWLTRAANAILDSWLKPTDVGFEWGSGRSTIWFARRVHHLTSVEHDDGWYRRVQGDLCAGRIDNVTLLHAGVEGGVQSDYVRAIEQFAPDSLDVVIVDGRLRHCCVLAALDRVRTGGLLVIDDAQRHLPSDSRAPGAARQLRDEWRPAAARLARWRCMWTSDGVSDTALFLKIDRDQGRG